MSIRRLGENVVEEAAIEYFRGAGPSLEGFGYDYRHGTDLFGERGGAAGVILETRFREALARINPHLPAETLDLVAREVVLRPPSPSVEENNLGFVRMLRQGVPVEVRRGDKVRRDIAHLVSVRHPEANDWLVVNQFTVVKETTARNERRPDLIVFLNGLPVAVFELKDPTDERATLDRAYNQLRTYRRQIPSLFNANEAS
jgi:type I restriction enzyme, R subunit